MPWKAVMPARALVREIRGLAHSTDCYNEGALNA
jgi:hypothetical protein